jgi:phosphohistidine swiveling domain-containing protein
MTSVAARPSAVWTPAAGPVPGASELGGKGHNLARLAALGQRVPPFFVLRADAVSSGDGDALAAAVREALPALGDGPLAVRSSAAAEDGAHASFAGQFQTVLGVAPTVDDVMEAVRRVAASAGAAHVEGYLRERGQAAGGMAVVVQRMLEPEAAGVAFSLDPVTGERDVAVVTAVPGLGEGLVSGALDADTFRVRFPAGGDAGGAEVSASLVPKERAVVRDPAGGVRTVTLDPARRDEPALSEEEARRIASAARALAAALGGPQDVEWALAPGEDGPRTLHLLQTRPVTAAARPAPAGERRTWDNENLVESFPGVVTALTFSVARRMVEGVYLGTVESMGATPERVASVREDLRTMVGRIRGRMYYEVETRRRVARAIPGMVTMHGEVVPGPYPTDPPGATPGSTAGLPAPLLLAAKALSIPHRMLADTARLDGEAAAFRARVAEVLDPVAEADLSGWDVDALRAAFDRIDREVQMRSHAPALNDHLLQYWMGVLGGLVAGWLPGEPPTLTNELLAGDGGIVSTEPVRELAALGARAREDDAVRTLLAGEPDDAAAWRRLTGDPALAAWGEALSAYLARYGDRCDEELKLEALTFAEDPGPIVQALRRAVAAPAPVTLRDPGALRAAAEARVQAAIPAGRRVVFDAVLAVVRRLTRDRENLRYARTRAFGAFRRLLLAIGARLADAGALDDARDVLHLSLEDLFGTLDGRGVSGDLKPLAAARRAELARWAAMPEPPARFATVGPPALSELREEGTSAGGASPSADGLRGMGCCAGVVRARVRVVRDPRDPGELAGRILVAQQTDPGWTLLFPAVAGVLVQRGSILSHAALVAREMGIPCVVGIPDLLSLLQDGEEVEMDGSTGLVRRISA